MRENVRHQMEAIPQQKMLGKGIGTDLEPEVPSRFPQKVFWGKVTS